MLAVTAAPFDSAEYSFECKWDGIRALAAVERGACRLWGRARADYMARYPELDVLRRLPAGTLVDGELVAFGAHGWPDLPRLLRRHGLTDPWRIRQAQHWCPVRYVLFDLVYQAGRCLLREPLARRREVLAELCQRLGAANVQFSAGVIGVGTAFYQAVIAQGHEGVMAKHLGSAYRPGRRSAAWRKIKPRLKGDGPAREVASQ
jgi:ATP-dependent DNA ligase